MTTDEKTYDRLSKERQVRSLITNTVFNERLITFSYEMYEALERLIAERDAKNGTKFHHDTEGFRMAESIMERIKED